MIQRYLYILLGVILLAILIEGLYYFVLNPTPIFTGKECSDYGEIVNNRSPNCDWQVVKFKTGSILYLKATLDDDSKVVLPTNTDKKLTLKIAFGQQIIVCDQPKNNPNVIYHCTNGDLSKIQKHIHTKVILAFDMSSSSCNNVNSKLANFIQTHQFTSKSFQTIQCAPIVTQVLFL